MSPMKTPKPFKHASSRKTPPKPRQIWRSFFSFPTLRQLFSHAPETLALGASQRTRLGFGKRDALALVRRTP